MKKKMYQIITILILVGAVLGINSSKYAYKEYNGGYLVSSTDAKDLAAAMADHGPEVKYYYEDNRNKKNS